MSIARSTLVIIGAVIVVFLLLPLSGSRFLLDLATQIMIYALFALSLNVLIGYTGNISFGHAAYFAIGGYACAILVTTYSWPLILGLAAAIFISAVAALVIGMFCVRLNEIYFAMLTLAFSMLVWSVLFKWRDVTGGDDGFVGVSVPALISDRTSFFYFVLASVSIATAILYFICHSAFGRALVAIRENEIRASFLGLNVRAVRLSAFVIAGSFAGLAGALFGLYNRGMYVESAFWTESAQVLIMTLLGGIYSFFGPMIGAAALYLMEVFINQFTQYWPIVLGGILLFIVLVAPDGLVGMFERVRSRWRSIG